MTRRKYWDLERMNPDRLLDAIHCSLAYTLASWVQKLLRISPQAILQQATVGLLVYQIRVTKNYAFGLATSLETGGMRRGMSEDSSSERYFPVLTVEAEYSQAVTEETVTQQWVFEEITPERAKSIVVSSRVPPGATLWRVGVWSGLPEDRPDGGHESDILEETDLKESAHRSLDEF